MRAVIFVAIGLSLSSAMAGCRTAPSGFSRARAHMAREFFTRDYSTRRQMQEFRRYNLDEQYDLFIFGNQVIYPPAQFLAPCFALNGAAAVELLREKLQEADRDVTVRDILRLLTEIDAIGVYDVAGDAELMAAATARVAQMKSHGWRDVAEEWLASMGRERREGVSFAPPCA